MVICKQGAFCLSLCPSTKMLYNIIRTSDDKTPQGHNSTSNVDPNGMKIVLWCRLNSPEQHMSTRRRRRMTNVIQLCQRNSDRLHVTRAKPSIRFRWILLLWSNDDDTRGLLNATNISTNNEHTYKQ